MRKQFLPATVLAASLSLFLAACGSGDTAAPADDAVDDVEANAAAADAPAMTTPVAATGDYIRSPGGLEDKCKAAIAAQGVTVVGTNRIEESEAAVEIYVNVEGGDAPWRCLGYKDGTIGDVMYTGSEGAA